MREVNKEKIALDLNQLSDEVYCNNEAKGFWDEPRSVAECIALIHSELSEALEADRKDLLDDHLVDRHGLEVELADAVIRILDLSGYLGLDIGGALVDKLEYNKGRPHKHGKNY